jgi:Secretion system C-terminal sorting domain
LAKSGIRLLENRSISEQAQLSNSIESLESEAIALLNLKVSGPGNNPAAWETAVALQTTQIKAEVLNYQTALSDLQVLRVNESAALISENSDINPVNVMAINEKTVNDIYLRNKLWSTAELSVIDINSVKSIADQCPHEGGLAVYMARNIYQRYFPTASWAGDMICSQERIEAGHIPDSQKFQIQPNPANSWVRISTEKPLEQDIWIKIIDINGQVIQSVLFTKGSTFLNIATDGFQPGFYFYRIQSGDLNFQQGKLIIMH